MQHPERCPWGSWGGLGGFLKVLYFNLFKVSDQKSGIRAATSHPQRSQSCHLSFWDDAIVFDNCHQNGMTFSKCHPF